MIQSGDSDWIINSHPACAEASAGRPLGIDSRLRSMAMGLQKMLVLIQKRAFYLATSHRQVKNPAAELRGIKIQNKKIALVAGTLYSDV